MAQVLPFKSLRGVFVRSTPRAVPGAMELCRYAATMAEMRAELNELGVR